jgi:tetratricopeptide (TPR) repeat protein
MPSIEQLEQLLHADPNDAFVLYGLAQEHAKRRLTDQAIQYFDRCLVSDPGYCYAYYHKARVLQQAGRIEEALATVAAGMDAARRVKDSHALSELTSFQDELA